MRTWPPNEDSRSPLKATRASRNSCQTVLATGRSKTLLLMCSMYQAGASGSIHIPCSEGSTNPLYADLLPVVRFAHWGDRQPGRSRCSWGDRPAWYQPNNERSVWSLGRPTIQSSFLLRCGTDNPAVAILVGKIGAANHTAGTEGHQLIAGAASFGENPADYPASWVRRSVNSHHSAFPETLGAHRVSSGFSLFDKPFADVLT